MGPAVSVVIPARDEAPYIDACVRSVIAQDIDADVEVLVVDGASTDGTDALARTAGATVVDNPERTIPAALNRGLAGAAGEVLIRFDAHGEMPDGYLSAVLRALREEPHAGNVGGWRKAEGVGPWGRAAGAALASPFGVGNAGIWRRPPTASSRRDVDTVPLGCFPVSLLRDLGGWRSDLLANEDFDLNYRIRRAGWRVVFDPAIWSVYRPRESLGEVARQYWRYGRWKAAMVAREPASLRARQIAPPLLVSTAVATAVPGPVGRAAQVVMAGYGLGLAAVASRSGAGWRTAPVLAAMHLGWGSAFLWGTIERSWTSRARPSS